MLDSSHKQTKMGQPDEQQNAFHQICTYMQEATCFVHNRMTYEVLMLSTCMCTVMQTLNNVVYLADCRLALVGQCCPEGEVVKN